MGRSVVHAGAPRCAGCCLPARWCVCGLLPPVETRLAVHVLIHRAEAHRPSSTGRLVGRAIPAARTHVYQRDTRFFARTGLSTEALDADRETWILHPAGEPMPSLAGGTGARLPQVVLLDGSWRQAAEMLRSVDGLGKRVRLPDTAAGESRYWLREQRDEARLSTAEALAAILAATGEGGAAERLHEWFELHVWATLRSRGRREAAERYLGASPLLGMPAVLARFDGR